MSSILFTFICLNISTTPIRIEYGGTFSGILTLLHTSMLLSIVEYTWILWYTTSNLWLHLLCCKLVRITKIQIYKNDVQSKFYIDEKKQKNEHSQTIDNMTFQFLCYNTQQPDTYFHLETYPIHRQQMTDSKIKFNSN